MIRSNLEVINASGNTIDCVFYEALMREDSTAFYVELYSNDEYWKTKRVRKSDYTTRGKAYNYAEQLMHDWTEEK